MAEYRIYFINKLILNNTKYQQYFTECKNINNKILNKY